MSAQNPNSILKLYCSVVGHQYKLEKKVTEHIKEYKCSCCGKEVTTNAKGNIVPLTDELRKIHESVGQIITKRRNRLPAYKQRYA